MLPSDLEPPDLVRYEIRPFQPPLKFPDRWSLLKICNTEPEKRTNFLGDLEFQCAVLYVDLPPKSQSSVRLVVLLEKTLEDKEVIYEVSLFSDILMRVLVLHALLISTVTTLRATSIIPLFRVTCTIPIYIYTITSQHGESCLA